MTENNPLLSYHQASANGASPVGQVVDLYDTILRDFGRALGALQAGDVETRVFELNHAVLVIGYLEYILNHDRGAEAAKLFEQFYAVTRAKIVEANFQRSQEAIEQLIELYAGLRQAWYETDQRLRMDQDPPGSAAKRDDAVESSAEPRANDEIDTPQLQWSA